MKQIFEQFQFIAKMFDTSSQKVQECGLWSAFVSFIIWFINMLTDFTVDIIGTSILYAILLFLVMVLNFITGIKASRKTWLAAHPGEAWKSDPKKALGWVIEYTAFLGGFFLINVLLKEVYTMNFGSMAGVNIDELFILIFKVIKLFFMIYIIRWKLKSIDENLEKLGYDFRIFDFLENAITAVTSLFKSKTGIEIKDKEDKENG